MRKGLQIEPGKPFVLPNGTEIRPNAEGNGRPEVVTKAEAEVEQELDEILEDPYEEDIATFQRTLADVRVSAQEFNPIMLILAYALWGLEASAIARLLQKDVAVIENVMRSDLYTQTRKEVLEAIRYAEASSIHGYLSTKARQAAKVLASKMSHKSPDVALAAANSVLDRAGFRPVDRVEHSHRFDDELIIKYVQDDKPPIIEVDM